MKQESNLDAPFYKHPPSPGHRQASVSLRPTANSAPRPLFYLIFFSRDGYDMDGSRLRVEISRGRRDQFGMGGGFGGRMGMGMGMGGRGGFGGRGGGKLRQFFLG